MKYGYQFGAMSCVKEFGFEFVEFGVTPRFDCELCVDRFVYITGQWHIKQDRRWNAEQPSATLDP